jgi:aspartate 1-decarboxylase
MHRNIELSRKRPPRSTPAGAVMLLTMMKAKLHRATVTQADLEYEGSIAIDRELLDASGILPHEQVDVLNITTGARFTTYAIEAPSGSRVIGVNGAAARLVQAGDKVIVVAYCQLDAAEARNYHPSVVLLDDRNNVKRAA